MDRLAQPLLGLEGLGRRLNLERMMCDKDIGKLWKRCSTDQTLCNGDVEVLKALICKLVVERIDRRKAREHCGCGVDSEDYINAALKDFDILVEDWKTWVK